MWFQITLKQYILPKKFNYVFKYFIKYKKVFDQEQIYYIQQLVDTKVDITLKELQINMDWKDHSKVQQKIFSSCNLF